MANAVVLEAIELLEKANANLQPELLSSADARDLMREYARAERLAAFGVAALTRKVDDTQQVARVTGTSTGKARSVVTTGRVMDASPALTSAFQHGDISLDQAAEIALAEEAAPGTARDLLNVAKEEGFHVLREKARKAKLEAEQHRDLAARQSAARHATTHSDELGMVHIHLALQPHVGTPVVARAEAEAERLAANAKREDEKKEPFGRYLADAFASLLEGTGRGRSRRPELVVLVSHEVARRGWSEVRQGEVCKIPGVGPVSPEVARGIAGDAFLSGLLYDGKDLRQLKRWTRSIPVEVRLALELGEPPDFDGVACIDCGNRFKTEIDHVQPHAAGGPTSWGNLKARCWSCHREKTARDRRSGRFVSGEP